jgi:hypothetical protein
VSTDEARDLRDDTISGFPAISGDTEVIPAAGDEQPVTWPAHGPGRKAVSCGPCGERFAGDPGLPFTSPVLAEALTEALTAAGWKQDGDAWTCSVCLARADAEPEPEAETPAGPAPEPAPAADWYAESVAILREFDARVPGFWTETNHANSVAVHKIYLRTGDRVHGIREQFGSAPSLLDSPELGWALEQGVTGLTQQLSGMRRDAAERDAWRRAQHGPRHAAGTGTEAAA